eukprot:2416225-Pyramimonas_sp.AAC.1
MIVIIGSRTEREAEFVAAMQSDPMAKIATDPVAMTRLRQMQAEGSQHAKRLRESRGILASLVGGSWPLWLRRPSNGWWADERRQMDFSF